MLKNISRLECKIGEKIYHLSCDCDSPLDHVKEALFQFQKYIGQIEDAIKAQKEAEEKSTAETKIDESKIESIQA